MSETCRRGHKCMCFQCGEKDCEKYQPDEPEWFTKCTEILIEKEIAEILRNLKEGKKE